MKRPIDLGRRNPACTAQWHGTESAYTYGCRCPHAREARRVNGKRRRQGRHTSPFVDATGTARRLQALAAIGWSYNELAARLGWPWRYIQRLAKKSRPTVERRTAQRVADVYRDLSARPGPSKLTRSVSAAKGWHTPIAWHNIDDPDEQPDVRTAEVPDDQVDEIAVRYATQGKVTYGRLRPIDREEAYRQMVAAGMGSGTIQDRLRISSTTLRRLADTAGAAMSGGLAA
jgi:hypothetical protein